MSLGFGIVFLLFKNISPLEKPKGMKSKPQKQDGEEGRTFPARAHPDRGCLPKTFAG